MKKGYKTMSYSMPIEYLDWLNSLGVNTSEVVRKAIEAYALDKYGVNVLTLKKEG